MDRRGHRRRQGDEQRAAAGLGVRWPRRRACRRRQLQPRARTPSCRAPPCRSTSASASPIRCWAKRSRRARPCSRTTACACGTTATASPWSASRPRCTPSATPCSTACRKRSASPNTKFQGLVIWQPKEPFSAGADLSGALGAAAGRQVRRVRGDGRQLPGHQPAHQVFAGAGRRGGARPGAGRRLRIPDARRPHGRRTGELHRPGRSRRRPAAGRRRPEGNRRARLAGAGPGGDVFAELKTAFETVAMGKVSASALEAKELGLVARPDEIVFNAYELLHVAKAAGAALAESGYRPPLPARRIPVAGDVGIATFKMMLVNMLEGRFISRARLRDRHPHRHRAVRRRGRSRFAGGRGMAAASSSASTSSSWRRGQRPRRASRTCSRPASR